ncbi:xanthine dehydrogenase family protein molybdopterin-binding subunit [Streptomyces sp. NPDC051561]|uniref:xanthine dehydrogenase family protein molybdopterin-binding subunit n=1 Tax=Streptomyces sp. NPDC051561 TaxID=3365658 RepID=UPI00378DCC34
MKGFRRQTREAAQEVRERGREQVPPRPGPRYVGLPVDRFDGPAKVMGSARYPAEQPYPGLLHAALVHATVTRGRISRIDTAKAVAEPGVVTVLTHHNAPALKPTKPAGVLSPAGEAAGSSVNYLGTDEVHWNGQPVAVVVASSVEAARHAASLVEVVYDTRPAVVDFAAARHDAVPQKSGLLQEAEGDKGDTELALAEAEFTVDLHYETPVHHHSAIEPHGTTAVWDGDRLTVHDTTQNLDQLRQHLAYKFDVPVKQVRARAEFVGGAFGGKAMVWPGTVLAVLAARVTCRPVRLQLTREGVYRTVGGRTPSTQRVALGARADGTLTALLHTSVAHLGNAGGYAEQITSLSHHAYAAENIHLRQHVVRMDVVPNTWMRAPGESIGSFALESAMDELAERLSMDPVALRVRNEPALNPLDERRKFSHRAMREVYEEGARRFGWQPGPVAPGSVRDGRWLIGRGVAAALHPALMQPAHVSVRVAAGEGALVRCAFHEIGVGAATAQAQIAADALGIAVGDVRVEYGDTDLPWGPGAGGSTQTASVAAALLTACEKARAKAGARPGEPVLDALRRRRRRGPVEVSVGSDSRLGRGMTQARFAAEFLRDRRTWVRAATGAHFCEVRVDPETGEVRVSRWVGVFDIGTVVNAKLAASQLRGGIVMGLGMALGEETLVDPRTGRITNATLSEYHVPVHADVPSLDVHFLNDADPTMPGGVVGAGEVGITGVAAAVANAVYGAVGRRARRLPVRLEMLM